MKGKKLSIGALGAIAVVGGIAVVAYLRPNGDPPPKKADPAAVPVIAVPVQKHDVSIILTGVGTVTALNSALIQSQITGLLVTVNFREGQAVKKGDLLAQLDPRTYQAQLKQAQATLSHDEVHLKNAKLNLQRYTKLSAENSIARQQVDDQEAAVDELNAQIVNDQASVAYAATQLSYTSLRAPFDGVTGVRLLDVGNIMQLPRPLGNAPSAAPESNALVLVTQIRPISVVFTLPAQDIPAVQDAMAPGPLQVMAFSQDDRTKLDTGTLLVINNRADPNSGTVQLKAVFPNADRRLWPGTFVNVRLLTSTVHEALTVPLDALQQGPQGRFVFVVDRDRKVTMRPVSVRQTFNAQALIKNGLSAGETVVVRGQYRLSPGVSVVLADPNNPNAVPNPSTASSGMLP